MSIPKSLEFVTMFPHNISGWACVLLKQSKTNSTQGWAAAAWMVLHMEIIKCYNQGFLLSPGEPADEHLPAQHPLICN